MLEWRGEYDRTTGWTEKQFSVIHILLVQSLKVIQECNNPKLPKLMKLALHAACRLNDSEIAEKILKESGVNPRELITFETDRRFTALTIACSHGATGSFNVILQQCIKENVLKDVLMKQDQDGYTPLHWTCHRGHAEIVQKLLEQYKNEGLMKEILMKQTQDGYTPLHWTCREGHVEISQMLVEQYKNEGLMLEVLLHRDENWRTPLHKTCMNGHVEISKVLLEQCKNERILMKVLLRRDIYGDTPLHTACQEILTYIVTCIKCIELQDLDRFKTKVLNILGRRNSIIDVRAVSEQFAEEVKR